MINNCFHIPPKWFAQIQNGKKIVDIYEENDLSLLMLGSSFKDIVRIDAHYLFDEKQLSTELKQFEFLLFQNTDNIEDIANACNNYSNIKLSFFLTGTKNLYEAINFITAREIPVIINLFSLIECNDECFYNICNHFFHSKLLKVPIEPLNSILKWECKQKSPSLSGLYNDTFGIDFFVNSTGNVFFSKSDFLAGTNSPGKVDVPFESIQNSDEYKKYRNKELQSFSDYNDCSCCPIFSFCRGYVLDYSSESDNNYCERLKIRFSIIKKKADELLNNINDMREILLNSVSSEKGTVFVSYKCVNDCVFCAASHYRDENKDRAVEDIILDIKKQASHGVTKLSLSGAGEPTLDTHLEDYVRTAAEARIKEIVVFTNGFGLDDERVLRLKENGLTGALISIHGLDEVHDLVVQREGSFHEGVNAIELFLKHGITCTINTCLTRPSIKNIVKLLQFVNSFDIQTHSVTFPEWCGKASMFKDIMITYSEAKVMLKDIAFSDFPKLIFDNFPLCVLSEEVKRVQNSNLMTMDQDGKVFLASNRSCNFFPVICNLTNCPKQKSCCGVDKFYVSIHSDDEFYKLRAGLSKIICTRSRI